MQDDAIRAFWEFWRASEAGIDASVAEQKLAGWHERIGQRISAIHPGLQWELGPGWNARHYFCVSAGGDMALRVIAERWRAAGPADGPVFELRASRPARQNARGWSLTYEGVLFDTKAFRVAIDGAGARERLGARIFHPSYALAAESTRSGATFLVLDGVLGEDEVERWLGDVEMVEAEPDGAGDLGALAEAVARLRARATGEHYAVIEGKLPSGAPLVASVNLAIKRVDHLLLDTHYQITVPLGAPQTDGLASQEEAAELDALEADLLRSLGRDAVHVGRETREGKRVIHLHAAPAGPAPARIEQWARKLPSREVRVEARNDPEWTVLRRW